MIPDYPGNSKNPRPATPPAEPTKNIESVVTSEVVARKKGFGKRVKEIFIGGDSKTVVQYVVSEVLVPQLKDMLTEGVSSGFERLIYGESSRRRPGARPGGGSRPTNYTNYAQRGNNPIGRVANQDRPATASLRTHPIEDLLFPSRVEAEAVLERMFDVLEKYQAVTVADLYAMIEWSSNHIDHKWGWEDLHNASVQRVRDGYVLNLSRPIALP
jgi:hypothetical protein